MPSSDVDEPTGELQSSYQCRRSSTTSNGAPTSRRRRSKIDACRRTSFTMSQDEGASSNDVDSGLTKSTMRAARRTSKSGKRLNNTRAEEAVTEISVMSNEAPDSDNFSPSSEENPEAMVSYLQKQLAGLQTRTRDLERELTKARDILESERAEFQDLEEEHLDIKLDLAESKRIRFRLEKENSMLQKRVKKLDIQNFQLQAKVDNLTGVTGDERNGGEFHESFCRLQDEEVPPRKINFKRHEGSSRGMWSSLAGETLSEDEVSDAVSTTMFDIFKSSNTLGSTQSTASSHSSRFSRQR